MVAKEREPAEESDQADDGVSITGSKRRTESKTRVDSFSFHKGKNHQRGCKAGERTDSFEI